MKNEVKDGKRKSNGRSSGRKLAAIGRSYKQREGARHSPGQNPGSAYTGTGTVETIPDGERESEITGSESGIGTSGVAQSSVHDNGSDQERSSGRGRGRGRGNGDSASSRSSTGTGTGTEAAYDVGADSRLLQRSVEPAPNRKARKPKFAKAIEEKQAELAANAGMLAVVYNSVFWGLSMPLGSHWILQKDELFQISNNTAIAIDSTFPESWLKIYEENLQKVAPIVALGVTLTSVISKRIQQGRIIAAKKTANGNAGKSDNGQDGEGSDSTIH